MCYSYSIYQYPTAITVAVKLFVLVKKTVISDILTAAVNVIAVCVKLSYLYKWMGLSKTGFHWDCITTKLENQ